MEAQAKTASEILAEYDVQHERFEAFRSSCVQLIESLLRANHLNVHSVSSRVKKRDSLSAKLSRLGKTYASLSDVTDLVGVRIITYFEDEVEIIGKMVVEEFAVDLAASVDKRAELDPDRFGYRSLHRVCALSPKRLQLAEHGHCAGLVCEIQIRTVLQHAWAEIEHDLGYKAPIQVAGPLRRRFSRLAGLLEIADEEFYKLRETIRAYTEEVRDKLSEQASDVAVDEVSLKEFLASDKIAVALSKQMADFVGASLNDAIDGDRETEQLHFVGVKTIAQLQEALRRYKNLILAQWRRRVNGELHDTLGRDICIYHLFQMLALEQGGVENLIRAFNKFSIASRDQRNSAVEIAAHVEASKRELSLSK